MASDKQNLLTSLLGSVTEANKRVSNLTKFLARAENVLFSGSEQELRDMSRENLLEVYTKAQKTQYDLMESARRVLASTETGDSEIDKVASQLRELGPDQIKNLKIYLATIEEAA